MFWSTFVVTETKERIAANLANFAYDPYNYTFLRQVRTPMYAVFCWLLTDIPVFFFCRMIK